MRKYLKKAIAVGLTSFMLLNFSGYQEVFAENENIELSAYTPIQGEGTKNSPYLVTDESQLVALANGELSSSAYYRLENNIKLRSYDWKPISDFSGVFDGNDHTISNLKIGELGSNYSGLGLFGSNSGTIKNLSVEINEIIGVRTTGGIVGYNSGTVDNCFTSGNIRANNEDRNIGGLVGSNEGKITSSISSCFIYGIASCVGGIIGYGDASEIQNCGFYGKLTELEAESIGGIIGKNDAYSSSGFIKKCYNNSTMNVSASNCGGIIGICVAGSDGFTMEQCYNNSNISSNDDCGGLIGTMLPRYLSDPKAYITECYNNGDISSNGNCGGLIGYIPPFNSLDEIYMNNCYNIGNVIGNKNDKNYYTAGIIGVSSYNDYMEIGDCYFAGNVTGYNANAITDKGSINFKNVFYNKSISGIIDKYNIGLTTEEMKNKDSYLFWDFDTIWNIDKNYNDGYPYLRSLGINASGVKLDKTTLDIVKGESYKLNANVLPSNAVNSEVIWKSKDVFVATVDKSGNITAVAPGTTTIVAITKDGGYTSECTVNVLDNAVTISCGDISTMPGKVIKVPVSIENNKGISSFGINITYDKNYLTPVGISDGTFFSGNIANLTYSDNVIRVTNASATNKVGDGVLFYISFNVKENIADTNSEIAIAVDQVKTINGSNTFDVDYHQKNGTVAIKNAVLGDVDNDGQVTANDATQILMNYALLKEFDELQKVAGDIDGDGMVTANDATQALLKYAGFNVEW